MSSIAEFKKLPKDALGGLRKAAVPTKKLFGGMNDTYRRFLDVNGKGVVSYEWSGIILVTLLCFLNEQARINLMRSEFDELSEFLTKARSATHFIFTDAHRSEFLARLSQEEFSGPDLERYFNDFNQSKEPVGPAMLDGVSALRKCLESLDSESVVILVIG